MISITGPEACEYCRGERDSADTAMCQDCWRALPGLLKTALRVAPDRDARVTAFESIRAYALLHFSPTHRNGIPIGAAPHRPTVKDAFEVSLDAIRSLIESGHAGVNPYGKVVDRRRNPGALPISLGTLPP